jgi:hypothetical protein
MQLHAHRIAAGVGINDVAVTAAHAFHFRGQAVPRRARHADYARGACHGRVAVNRPVRAPEDPLSTCVPVMTRREDVPRNTQPEPLAALPTSGLSNTTTVGGFTVANTPRLPRNEPRTETTAAAAPVVHQTIYQFGPGSGPRITVEGKDGDELFREWLSVARRKANATNGAKAPLSAAWEPV